MSDGWVLIVAVVLVVIVLGASRTRWARGAMDRHPLGVRAMSSVLFGTLFCLGGRYVSHRSWGSAVVTGVGAGVFYGVLTHYLFDRNSEAVSDDGLGPGPAARRRK